MQNLTPYLMFNGTCEAAINFYKDCLDGEIIYMGKYGDSPMEVGEEHSDKVMHTTLTFWGGSIMASDHTEKAGYTTEGTGSNVHLSLGFKDLKKMESTFKALAQGGTVTMELQDTFWGDKFGMLCDKFGTNWMFSYNPNPDKNKS